MKYAFYLQNGIATDILPNEYSGFYVAENLETTFSLNRYFFPGDDIQYDLDDLCVGLYDVFQNAIFPSKEDFYENYGIQPQWISRAGLDSAFDMSKEELITCFSTPLHEKMVSFGVCGEECLQAYKEIDDKKFMYAYTSDCQSLVDTLQELIMGCHGSVVGFYKHLCSLNNNPETEGPYYECSSESRMVFSFLYNFIIQSYSIFDILTKIVYELEHLKSCNNAYAKLASSGILYGDRNRLNLDANGTVFEKCRATAIIENLRNELIHNATWEMNPKIFTETDNGMITSRYIFFPDLTAEGTLASYKNRKRFFSERNKVNDVLPELYFDIMKRILTTLNKVKIRQQSR